MHLAAADLERRLVHQELAAVRTEREFSGRAISKYTRQRGQDRTQGAQRTEATHRQKITSFHPVVSIPYVLNIHTADVRRQPGRTSEYG
jgi:hypothetical protein